MIVADCTLIARFLLGAQDYARAEALWLRDPEWVAPALWEAEFANVLLKYERAGQLSAVNANEHAQRAKEMFAGYTHYVTIDRALEAARRIGCSSYDSYYVALAEDLGAKLYSYNKALVKRCRGLALEP